MTEEQKEYEAIGRLIGSRLRTLATDQPVVSDSADHLDADTVAAFTEGRVEEPGASLIASHLITCSSCRIATTRTMHLESAIPPELDIPESDASPGRLRRFLDDLTGKVFTSSEEVVFAYQEPSKEAKPATEDTSEGATFPVKSESENDNRS